MNSRFLISKREGDVLALSSKSLMEHMSSSATTIKRVDVSLTYVERCVRMD